MQGHYKEILRSLYQHMQSISWYKKEKKNSQNSANLGEWVRGEVWDGEEIILRDEPLGSAGRRSVISPAVRLQFSWVKTTSRHKLDENYGNKRKKCCAFADTAYHLQSIPDTCSFSI